MGETQKQPFQFSFNASLAALWAIALVILLFPLTASAANLKPETLKTWDEYVQAATAQMQERLNSNGPFLWADEAPDRGAKLRNGEIVASPAGPHIPKRVPSGLIHHWIGATFIPNATLHDVPACRPRLRTLQGDLPPGRDRFQSHRHRRIGRPVFHAADEQIGHLEDRAR